MVRVIFGVAVLASIVGLFLLVLATGGRLSAPQQAAGAAIAIGWAVVPYVFVRLLQIDHDRSEQTKFRENVLDELRRIAERDK